MRASLNDVTRCSRPRHARYSAASVRTATSGHSAGWRRCSFTRARRTRPPCRSANAVVDRRPARVEALANALGREGLDGVLLTSAPNIRYITGFSGSSALAFVTSRSDVLFVTDFRYKTQVAEEVGDVARIAIEPQSLWTGLWQLLPSLPYVEVAGFESGQLVHRDFQRLLEAGGRWSWRPTTDLVETLRESKDPGELALIKEAAGVATRALGRTLPLVATGLTELAVAGR